MTYWENLFQEKRNFCLIYIEDDETDTILSYYENREERLDIFSIAFLRLSYKLTSVARACSEMRNGCKLGSW